MLRMKMFGKMKWLIVIALVLACMACDLESENKGGGNQGDGDATPSDPVVTNPFLGTWQGTWVGGGNQRLALSFTETMYNWTLVDGGGWGFSGLYTYQGNNASLHGEMPGTAEIKGNDLYLSCNYFGTETVICRK